MGSLWQGKTYLYNASSLLNSNWVNRRGLDLSKEVLWASVGQLAAKLQAVKVWDLKKILLRGPPRTTRVRPALDSQTIIVWESNAGCTCVVRGGPRSRIFFRFQTLTACSFAALWPTETHSTSFERSKPHLLTQSLSKRLEALWR